MQTIKLPVRDHLYDPFDFLGPKRKQMLESGWPHFFREYLYGELPVDAIQSAFHASQGRPSKELTMALGVLLLQQLYDLTDAQAVRQLAFNTEWHYALNLHTEDDESKTMCERTLRTYRALVIEREVDSLLFQSLTDKLLDHFQISPGKQRLDSTHIRSNMRRLSRLELFRKSIEKFLKVLQHDHPRLLQAKVETELLNRYLDEKKGNFAQVKPSEAKATLQSVAEDLLVLVETFGGHPKIRRMEAFVLLQRVLNEQCEVHGEGEEAKVELKEPKEVSSKSLQNPSDADAGYSGHKGEGYQVQLMETYTVEEPSDESGGKEEMEKPNFITYAKVEPAYCSDSEALLPAIQETKERGCAPVELVADSAYGSDDNVQQAAQEGVDVIAPTMGKPKSKEKQLILDDFTVDRETGRVTGCPGGEAPSEIREGEKGKLTITFDATICAGCDHRDYCCVGLDAAGKPAGADHRLEYTPKQLRLAQRRVAEESDEFREKYRWRSGIEAVNAKLKRVMKLGRLRVRGLARVRYAVNLKVLGWNILQAVRA